MNYKTSIPFGPAVSPATRSQALSGLGARQNMGSANDTFDAYAAANRTAYDRAAQEADMSYMQQARDTQQQMAMRGLEQLAQQQQNNESIASRRQEMAGGYLNSILSGLFR